MPCTCLWKKKKKHIPDNLKLYKQGGLLARPLFCQLQIIMDAHNFFGFVRHACRGTTRTHCLLRSFIHSPVRPLLYYAVQRHFTDTPLFQIFVLAQTTATEHNKGTGFNNCACSLLDSKKPKGNQARRINID